MRDTPLPNSSTNKRVPKQLLGRALLIPYVKELLRKCAVEEVFEKSPAYFSRLFLVSKSDGSQRLIIEMETVRQIKICLQRDDLITSADMIDAFFHVMLNKKLRHLVRFQIGDRIFSFAFQADNRPICIQQSLQTCTCLPKEVIDTHSHFPRRLAIHPQDHRTILPDHLLHFRSTGKTGFWDS